MGRDKIESQTANSRLRECNRSNRERNEVTHNRFREKADDYDASECIAFYT